MKPQATWATRGFSLLCVVGMLLGAGPSRADGEPIAARQAPPPVLTAQLGHGDGVTSAAFSPDGAHVLTGSVEKTARLWETTTGKEVRHFDGHTSWVSSVAFSPDGAHVLTGSDDRTARLWETATGKELQRFEGHTNTVWSVAFSPDGAQVLTGSADRTARRWETTTGREVQRLEGHEMAVLSAAFSPDGAHVLTGSEDYAARLFETASGHEVRSFEGHEGGVVSVAFSSDGTHMLTGAGDHTARLWETATGREVRRFEGHTDSVWSTAFSGDGTRVLTGSWDATARLWETATGQEVRRFEGHTSNVTSAVFSRDGAYVLTGSWDQTARLWDAASTQEVRRFEGQADLVTSVAFSPDGTRLLTGSWDGTARLWDATAEHDLRRFQGHIGHVNSAVFSPDGAQVLTGSQDRTARLWETATGREVRRFEGHARQVISVAFSPDGAHVLTGSQDRTARLWDSATGEEVQRFEGHTELVWPVAFSPDGTHVLTGSWDGTVRLWEPASGREVRRFEGHTGHVTSAAFSPDGAYVLTGSDDRTARLWDAATGREVRRFEGHPDPVVSVAFSPDGAQVLTGSLDQTARLWDRATGREEGRFEGHTGDVQSLAFSPDGTRLLTGSYDGTSRLWDVATSTLLCTALSFRDGSWAVTDPSGRFDASHGGDVEGLHWVVGTEVISLDQLKDRYYEPGLLAKILGFNEEPLRQVAAFSSPRLYPSVHAELEDGKCRILLENRGGGIGRVVVVVNGKERTADARGPAADPDAEVLALEVDLTDDPRLVPGRENRIEVFAYNAEGYLRSRGLLRVSKPRGKEENPALWAVIAGISDYRGRALDLRFAAKDAQDFAKAVRIAGTSLFTAEHTHVTLLTDAGARREALVEALKAARQAKAGDILVLYLAGHGVNRGEGFYYLTADAETADLSDPNQQRTTALSSTELVEAIKEIPALKQVLILDTCASGGFIEALTGKRAVPSSQMRALDRVKDRTGMFVLAGCASDRVSYEASRYGQGLLTYSLLLGMKGGRLRENEYVDVSTLFNFAADKVPEFAREIGGIQRPILAVPRAGSSFDIGRLTEKEQAEVPLNAVRPLFNRSSFQDLDEGADVLDLGQLVNKALGEETALGRKAALVFVDVPRFPGAFRIAGNYQTKDGTTTVRFRLRRDRKAVTDWIEIEGRTDELAVRILKAARKHLPTPRR